MTASQPREPIPEADPPELPSAPDPPAVQPHRWGFGAFLLVEAVLLATAAFVSALLGQPPAGSPIPIRDVLVGTIAPTVIAALTAVLITRIRGNGPLADLRISWNRADVKVGLRLGVIGLVCTTVGAFVWTQVVGEQNASSAIGALVDDQRMSVSAAIVMFLYVWLLGPICEEVIYRGLLWGAVERLNWGAEKWGRLAAFLISTAVFAVSHLEPLRTTLLLVIAVPIGLARLFTGRLLGSVIAHQMNNFLPALAILLTALGVVTL
ncbi:CPBP family intramembrane glutamic endopeptidase [Amycolatopsis nigrescens]|uniref:CPBP family intramembrane glutamic endopeptidase n=1 Tax=Amycolatopsis nigrescens TaxID=381445 RepID=UPI00037ED231|nr:CPBP family intramembrane glutamic endopeptidase [Amycolatopsis nigrescens]